jgi:hypothetical protein
MNSPQISDQEVAHAYAVEEGIERLIEKRGAARSPEEAEHPDDRYRREAEARAEQEAAERREAWIAHYERQAGRLTTLAVECRIKAERLREEA